MNLFPVDDDGVIDIFGFKLHTDDLLIILILFILYKEDVKDKFLYIALILLLLNWFYFLDGPFRKIYIQKKSQYMFLTFQWA